MEAKAAKVEAMSEEELLELKTGGGEKYDQDKTMQQILEDAAEQLKEFVQGLKYQDQQQQIEFATSAFVVLAVGSRRFIWRRIHTD